MDVAGVSSDSSWTVAQGLATKKYSCRFFNVSWPSQNI